MSYFGQRLNIYFSCEREQLSNRLITMLRTSVSPAAPGRATEPAAAPLGPPGSLEQQGGGPRHHVPPDPPPPCQGRKTSRAAGGRGAAAALSSRG